jgi:hypothetical protein
MPKGDRTGPMGTGSMTGRGAGYCAGFGAPGYANTTVRGFGRGPQRVSGSWGGGFGGAGRGWRHRFYATGVPGRAYFGRDWTSHAETDLSLEKQTLESRYEALKSELESIRRRLSDIEPSSEPQAVD